MTTVRTVSGLALVALLSIFGHDTTLAAEATKPDAPSQAEVLLGEPAWSTSIRNERWVRTHVAVTNRSDFSYWVSGYSTKLLFHDYERRRSAMDPWERLIGVPCGTGAVAHEILPHSVFEFDLVLPAQDVGKEVRLRLLLYRRMEYSGSYRHPPILKERQECVSNVVLIPRDASGTQPSSRANRRQPSRF